MTLLLPSCIVPAPVEEAPPAVTAVIISQNKVDPPAFEIVSFDPLQQPGLDFSLQNAVTKVGIDQLLRFSWYYDFDPANPDLLDAYAVCRDDARCKLVICQERNSKDSEHRLLAIASTHPLKTNPKGPFDFPEAAVFDSVTWTIKVGPNTCPSSP